MKTLDGVVEGRTLAIGMPLLKELSLQELKAVLAHEFSHFSGNDTLYSVFVAPVYKSLGSAIEDLKTFTFDSIKFLLLLQAMFLSASQSLF